MLRGIFSFIFIFYCIAICGQGKVLDPNKSISQYSLNVWTTDDGLPSIALTDILQANDEYIWIATYNGLARFDGFGFTNYTIDNVPELHSNAITTLEFYENTLWVGTHKGIVSYKSGRFYEDERLTSLAETSIEELKFDEKGRLFIGTTAEGLYMLDGDKLEKLTNPLLASSPVGSIIADKSGTVWVGTDKGELFKYQGNDLRLTHTSDVTKGITALYVDQLGVVWMTTGNGIFTLSDGGGIVKHDALSVGGEFGDLVQDNYGDVWTTNKHGIVRYSAATKNIEEFTKEEGLPNELIRKMHFDHQGNLWIASYRSGLFQLTDGIFTTFSENEGLSGSVVTSLIEIKPNVYWIASEGGHIDVLENGSLNELSIRGGLPSARLKHLMHDSRGNVWVATYGGLVRLDEAGNKKELPNQLKGMDEYIRMTFEDKAGNLWIGTRRTGLYKLDWNGKLTHFHTKNGLSSNFIMSIDQGATGEMLVGTKNGINIIQDNAIVDLINQEDGLPTNFIFDVYEDGDILWIGVDIGLCRYEKSTKKSTLYNTNNGLNESIVFDIVPDSMGMLWLTSNSGVLRVSKEELASYAMGSKKSITAKLFNKSDGMKSEQCVGATKMLVDRDGKIWIPTVVGVAAIHPKEIAKEHVAYSTHIEDIISDNQTFLAIDDIDIEAGNGKRIQISFTAFDYIDPSKIAFSYKLEPFDDEWQYTTDRHVDYTNLAPNQYTFKVKPATTDQSQQTDVAQVDFHIQAYFYETSWFYVVCVLVLFLAIYLMTRYRLEQIKKREDELQRRVAVRTREVVAQRDQIQVQREKIETAFEELKDAQMQLVESEKMASLGQLTAGIAHELKNPINFVFAGINALKVQVMDLLELSTIYANLDEEKDAAKIEALQQEIKALKEEIEFEDLPADIEGLIHDIEEGAERTAEIVKSLRVFTRSDDSTAFQLTDIHDILNSTLIILRTTYKDRIHVKKEFHDLPMVTCNVGKMGQVFTNLIANAVDAIADKGTITIGTKSFKASEADKDLVSGGTYVKVSIQDTGEGIKEEHLKNIFEAFFTTKAVGAGTGLGLPITKDIIDQHQGQILVESEQGLGTTFSVIIPVEQDA